MMGSGFMYIKDIRLSYLTICIMLIICDFLINGINKLKAKNVYEDSWYLSFILGIFGFFISSFQYFDALRIRDITDFMKYWWIYSMIFLVLAHGFYRKLSRQDMVVYNIAKTDLEQIVTEVFEKYNFPFETRTKGRKTILTVKDVNTVIVITGDDFSEDTYHLQFVWFRRIPDFNEVLKEIKDLINARTYKKHKFRGIFDIVASLAALGILIWVIIYKNCLD